MVVWTRTLPRLVSKLPALKYTFLQRTSSVSKRRATRPRWRINAEKRNEANSCTFYEDFFGLPLTCSFTPRISFQMSLQCLKLLKHKILEYHRDSWQNYPIYWYLMYRNWTKCRSWTFSSLFKSGEHEISLYKNRFNKRPISDDNIEKHHLGHTLRLSKVSLCKKLKANSKNVLSVEVKGDL